MKEKKRPGRIKSAIVNWLGETIGLNDAAFWQEWYGTSSSGKVVTAEKALALAAVWACVRLLSESVSTLPMKIYERSAARRKYYETNSHSPELSRRRGYS